MRNRGQKNGPAKQEKRSDKAAHRIGKQCLTMRRNDKMITKLYGRFMGRAHAAADDAGLMINAASP
jgi:ribosomal protein S4